MSLRCYGPGLYGWGRFQDRWSFDFNGHAVVCDDGTVLVIDPIQPTAEELEAVRALGSRFVVVVLNSDHERAAGEVSAVLDAAVWAPAADIGEVGVPGAQTYQDGHVFPGDWRVITLSDLKTPGESVLYNAQRRTLIVGDAVVGDPVNGLRFVPPMKIADQALALKSVARLADLDFDTLLLSDGYCLAQGGRAVLQGFLAKG